MKNQRKLTQKKLKDIFKECPLILPISNKVFKVENIYSNTSALHNYIMYDFLNEKSKEIFLNKKDSIVGIFNSSIEKDKKVSSSIINIGVNVRVLKGQEIPEEAYRYMCEYINILSNVEIIDFGYFNTGRIKINNKDKKLKDIILTYAYTTCSRLLGKKTVKKEELESEFFDKEKYDVYCLYFTPFKSEFLIKQCEDIGMSWPDYIDSRTLNEGIVFRDGELPRKILDFTKAELNSFKYL